MDKKNTISHTVALKRAVSAEDADFFEWLQESLKEALKEATKGGPHLSLVDEDGVELGVARITGMRVKQNTSEDAAVAAREGVMLLDLTMTTGDWILVERGSDRAVSSSCKGADTEEE